MSRNLVFLSAVGLLLVLASGVQAQEGNVLFEYWFNIGGTSIGDLTGQAVYPYGPDSFEYRPDLKSKVDWFDNGAQRARSYLVPPESGDYTFWVSGDDQCQLWLSTDETAANAQLIATVGSWTSVDTWDWEANQKSTPIALQAGQKYYVEMLMKEGGGGDSISAAWAGPGIGNAPTVIRGDYLAKFVAAHPAYKPDPANGTADVTSPMFQWTMGKTAALNDVYFGTDPNLGPDTFKSRQPFALYVPMEPLTPGARYYWRIDSIEADGVTIYTGDVWTFTVMPVKAYDLSPYDGAPNRHLDTKLSWKAGNMAQSHNVYFGTDQAAVAAADASVLQGNQEGTEFDPNGLAASTTYYWRVDEIDAFGATVVGDVLSFSTMDEAEHGATREVWFGIDGGAVSDLTGSAKFAGPADDVSIVPDFEAPTDVNDSYGQRVRAWLNVPAAGEYTFWVASDDASKLYIGADQFSAEPIAEVTGWTSSRAWDSEAGQQSVPIALSAGKYFLMALMKEGGGGDNLAAAWQGGPIAQRELILGGFLEPYVPLWAEDPTPADGAVDIPYLVELTWKAGVKAAAHDVYLGTDKNAVANATRATGSIYKGQVTEAAFSPAALTWNKTYFWRIDEVNDAEAGSPWKGTIWSFSVPDYIPVVTAPETLDYDNTADPFVSEMALEYATPQNWTVNGVTSLQLDIKGGTPKYSGSPAGSFTLNGAGADVWGAADEFRYAYKSLTGDGSIVARVAAIGAGSSTWAKGGVMVRGTLDGDSPHMIMALTGGDGGGIAFQGRQTAGGNSSSLNGDVTAAAPYWLRLTRAGNAITASYSADGVTWTDMADTSPDNAGFAMSNPVNVEMAETVYIGLFVTSHAAGELRSFTFDNVATTGNVTGDWLIADVGVAQGGNDPAPLYVTLQDSAGKSAKVTHPGNPNAVLYADWTPWKILLSKFSGVNLKAITKVTVGVGNGQPDGNGSIQVDNVRVVKPIQVAVVNPSFEMPGTPDKYFYKPPELARSLNALPGWSTDKPTNNAGFIKGAWPTQGSWSAYLTSGGYSLWQLTDHVIVEGEVFQLDVDALVIWGGVRDDQSNLKLSLYYDDGGKRVTVASSSTPLPYDPVPRSMTFSASDVRACLGHRIGIELSNVRKDNIIGVDNVRFKVR
jgi:hypothetical protein